MKTITYTETLVTVTCTCGVNFAIPDALNRRALSEGARGKGIYCPLGHSWVYAGKSDEQKAREAQDEAARLRAWLDQEQARTAELERSRTALKGELTKARKRAAAAVCPVPDCKRQIVQMKRHLATKHPDWHPHGET